MKNNIKVNKWAVRVFLLLTVVVYGGWMFSVGPLGDDLWYNHVFELRPEDDVIESSSAFVLMLGRPVETLYDVWESVVNHNIYWNNGRLANAFMFLSNLAPEWLVDCIHALFFIIMFVMMCELSGVKWRNNFLYVVLSLWLIWVVLPWGNYIIVSDFQMNYIWSSALNMIVVWGLIYSDKAKVYPITFGIVSIIAAMMHEAFTLAMICGLTFWLIQNAKSIRNNFGQWKIVIVISILYCVGALMPLLSPALYTRIGDASRDSVLWYYIVHNIVLKYYLVFFVVLILGYVAYRLNTSVVIRFLKENIVLIIIAFVEFVIAIYSLNYSRGLFFGIIMLIVLFLRSLNLVVDFDSWNGKGSLFLSVLLGGTYLYWMINVDMKQYASYKELDKLRLATSETLNNMLFEDVTTEHDVPWYYFSDVMCVAESYHATAWIGCLELIDEKDVAENKKWKKPIVMPKRYETIPFEKWDTVAGNTSLRGCWPHYFSETKLGVNGMTVEYASPLDSCNKKGVNYVYTLPDIVSDLFNIGNNGVKRVYVTLREEYRAVPEYLKRDSVFNCDSIWVYSFDRAGESVKGRRILSIDK